MKKIYKKPIIEISKRFLLDTDLMTLSSEEIKPGDGPLPDDADIKERETDTVSWDNGLW